MFSGSFHVPGTLWLADARAPWPSLRLLACVLPSSTAPARRLDFPGIKLCPSRVPSLVRGPLNASRDPRALRSQSPWMQSQTVPGEPLSDGAEGSWLWDAGAHSTSQGRKGMVSGGPPATDGSVGVLRNSQVHACWALLHGSGRKGVPECGIRWFQGHRQDRDAGGNGTPRTGSLDSPLSPSSPLGVCTWNSGRPGAWADRAPGLCSILGGARPRGCVLLSL